MIHTANYQRDQLNCNLVRCYSEQGGLDSYSEFNFQRIKCIGGKRKIYKQNRNGGKDVDFPRTVFVKKTTTRKMKNNKLLFHTWHI